MYYLLTPYKLTVAAKLSEVCTVNGKLEVLFCTCHSLHWLPGPEQAQMLFRNTSEFNCGQLDTYAFLAQERLNVNPRLMKEKIPVVSLNRLQSEFSLSDE